MNIFDGRLPDGRMLTGLYFDEKGEYTYAYALYENPYTGRITKGKTLYKHRNVGASLAFKVLAPVWDEMTLACLKLDAGEP